MRSFSISLAITATTILLPLSLLRADVDAKFHNAPESAQKMKNPYGMQPAAIAAGKQLFARNCVSCHGRTGEGTGNVPSLIDGKLETATAGEVFWFITKGDKDNGMPSWAQLPEKQRWQIVSFVKSLGLPQNAQAASPLPTDNGGSTIKAPPPTPPFTDFRYEKPGTVRKITVNDLPQPYATSFGGERTASSGAS